MGHIHNVYDADIHFLIDSITRVVKVHGKNLLNIDAGLNESFIKNSDGTYTIQKINGNRFSQKIPIKASTGDKLTAKVYEIGAEGHGYMYIQVLFADGTSKGMSFDSEIDTRSILCESDAISVRIYIPPDGVEGSFKTFKNIQIELGNTATDYTPYIDPTTVTVRRCGKNLFDVSNYKTLNGNLDVNEQDGNSHTVQGAVGGSTNSYSSGAFTIKLPNVISNEEVLTVSLYVTLQEQGAWSNAIRLWCVDRAEDFADYRTFELEVGKRTKITASFTVENADSLARLTFYVNNNKLLLELDTLQIEKGNDATDYEPYKGTEHTPSSDGIVSGMMSTSPNMTILTDTEGVVIDCEYIVDTKTYIDKKFQKLAELFAG